VAPALSKPKQDSFLVFGIYTCCYGLEGRIRGGEGDLGTNGMGERVYGKLTTVQAWIDGLKQETSGGLAWSSADWTRMDHPDGAG
jgi:hypothetical protein